MFRKIKDSLRRLAKDNRGNVFIIMGFLIIPIVGCIGFAVDYGITLMDKAKLNAAADAAAITAINTVKSVLTGGGTTTAALAQAQTAGLAAFNANAGQLTAATLPTPTINVPTPTSATISATVTYATTENTTFSKVIGIPVLNVAGSSAATLTMPVYQNYYIVLDVSNSMGIGSTPTDMANLFNRAQAMGAATLNNGGCVFGCHVKSDSDPYSMEEVAHNSAFGTPITLRIDAALSAIQSVITNAQNSQTNSLAMGNSGSLIQIGLYTMSGFATTGTTTVNQPNPPGAASTMLNTISNLTTNFAALLPLAASPASSPLSTQTPTIDLSANNGLIGYGDSYSGNGLTDLYNNVLFTVSQGNGATPATPQNFVFIITDGVEDTYSSSCTWGHCVSAFNSANCANLQTKATVGVIYTTYNVIYTNNDPAQGLDNRYSTLVDPIAANIAPSLQACASSNLFYFEATDGPAITTGMQQLMANAAKMARLSN